MSQTPSAPTTGRQDGGAGSFAQAGRLLAIETALGPDALLLTGLAGEDEISRPFRFELSLVSVQHDIKPETLVGTRATVWLRRIGGKYTPLGGVIRRFRTGRMLSREFREYGAELVPWLWFLSMSTDSRIFQNLSVPKVIETVFKTFGFQDYEMSALLESYPERDYIVQYRETALAFVCRLAEEVGIHFHVRHQEQRHVIVFGDHNISFLPAPEAEVGYANDHKTEIKEWQHDYCFRSGAWAQKDFNFETPNTALLTKEKSMLPLANAAVFERFDYPGRYDNLAEGTALTRVRIEEEEARYHTVLGGSGCTTFRAGMRFTLNEHPLPSEMGAAYILTRVTHRASQSILAGDGVETEEYANWFEAIPAEPRYRPPCVEVRPFVHGAQTALVVGPPGETIHTDEQGRVKLQFHWDRRGKRDDRSSCWVRVSQGWAGSGWGAVFIPHVGHEVIVSFLEGDPDRPIVTGRVYNGNNKKNVSLPGSKTQSALQDHGGNRIVMEGKEGVEDIRTIATKDMNTNVGNDANLKVHNNRTAEVTVNDTEKVGGKQDVTINGTSSMHASGEREVVLGAGHKHSVAAAEQWLVSGERKLTVNGHYDEVLGAGLSITVTGDTMIMGSGEITLNAGSKMSLIVGGSSIVLTPSGITITASGDVTVLGATIKHNT